jgi:hypothetical protein
VESCSKGGRADELWEKRVRMVFEIYNILYINYLSIMGQVPVASEQVLVASKCVPVASECTPVSSERVLIGSKFDAGLLSIGPVGDRPWRAAAILANA